MHNSYSTYSLKAKMRHGLIQPIMGTRMDVLIIGLDNDCSDFCFNEIVDEAFRVEKMLNKFSPDSEVHAINDNAATKWTKVSDELWDILVDCKKYHKLTHGCFDITLKNFTTIDFDFETKSVFFNESDIELDLGAYGKGYALEQIKQRLIKHQVECALINLGNSSILAVGTHPYGEYWPIGIENPFNPKDVLGYMHLKDNSLSISGNTPNHPKHIMNPHTGEFIESRKVISVKMRNAVEAEILSTALMVAPQHLINEILQHFAVEEYSQYELDKA